MDRARARQREASLQKARDSASLLWRLIRQGYLRASWLFTDHTRNALILSVFAFKVNAPHAYHQHHSLCAAALKIASCGCLDSASARLQVAFDLQHTSLFLQDPAFRLLKRLHTFPRMLRMANCWGLQPLECWYTSAEGELAS